MDKIYNILGKIALGLIGFVVLVCFSLSQFRIIGDFERIEFHPNLFGFPKYGVDNA